MTDIPPVLLVGCGRMGAALLAGWERQGLEPSVVLDPAGPELVSPHRVVRSPADVPTGFRPSAVVLAIKPQQADTALQAVLPLVGDAVVLSIMAGLDLARLSRMLPMSPIVRAMPNTPAAIGRGVAVAVAGPAVSPGQRELSGRLLSAVGSFAWCEDEALLDPVTAVSGSGPAYVFLLAELLEQAGIAEGLPPPLARQLARETVAGAGALLAASSEDAAGLRRAVTSPGGTTQAALDVLMDPAAWPRALHRAVAAATARSRALAS